jgi:predicted  nucleic acid-binding Zn-ribbon protein
MSTKGQDLYERWRGRVLLHKGSEPREWLDLFDHERSAWEDIAGTQMDRGTAINRIAQVGSEMLPIRAQLSVLRAQFDKTKNTNKRAEIQKKIDKMGQKLTSLETEYKELMPIAGWAGWT